MGTATVAAPRGAMILVAAQSPLCRGARSSFLCVGVIVVVVGPLFLFKVLLVARPPTLTPRDSFTPSRQLGLTTPTAYKARTRTRPRTRTRTRPGALRRSAKSAALENWEGGGANGGDAEEDREGGGGVAGAGGSRVAHSAATHRRDKHTHKRVTSCRRGRTQPLLSTRTRTQTRTSRETTNDENGGGGTQHNNQARLPMQRRQDGESVRTASERETGEYDPNEQEGRRWRGEGGVQCGRQSR